MKTSLILDDRVFEEAKKEAARTGHSVSEVVSQWAALGREVWRSRRGQQATSFKPLDLGAEQVDLMSRKDWMEELDNDRT